MSTPNSAKTAWARTLVLGRIMLGLAVLGVFHTAKTVSDAQQAYVPYREREFNRSEAPQVIPGVRNEIGHALDVRRENRRRAEESVASFQVASRSLERAMPIAAASLLLLILGTVFEIRGRRMKRRATHIPADIELPDQDAQPVQSAADLELPDQEAQSLKSAAELASRKGICDCCGQEFVEDTRVRPHISESWDSILERHFDRGVCPRCYNDYGILRGLSRPATPTEIADRAATARAVQMQREEQEARARAQVADAERAIEAEATSKMADAEAASPATGGLDTRGIHVRKRRRTALYLGVGVASVAVAVAIVVASSGPSSAQCARLSACAVSGQCSASGGKCVAAGDADCAGSDGCRSDGRCSAVRGQCVATTEAQCQASESCKSAGRCWIGSDGQCFDRDFQCKQPPYSLCEAEGLCVFVDGKCTATTETCRASRACRERGLCTAPVDRCVSTSTSDCAASSECRSRGACVLGASGRCEVPPLTDADCRAQSTAGRTKAIGGYCCGPEESPCLCDEDYIKSHRGECIYGDMKLMPKCGSTAPRKYGGTATPYCCYQNHDCLPDEGKRVPR